MADSSPPEELSSTIVRGSCHEGAVRLGSTAVGMPFDRSSPVSEGVVPPWFGWARLDEAEEGLNVSGDASSAESKPSEVGLVEEEKARSGSMVPVAGKRDEVEVEAGGMRNDVGGEVVGA